MYIHEYNIWEYLCIYKCVYVHICICILPWPSMNADITCTHLALALTKGIIYEKFKRKKMNYKLSQA
jgi:hypothetical protein